MPNVASCDDELKEIFSEMGEVVDVTPELKEIIREQQIGEELRLQLANTLRFMFAPGMMHLVDGEKGGGKTHLGIAISQMLVEGELYPEAGTYELVTNVLTVQRVSDTGFDEDDLEEECPPGVHFVTSLVEMLDAFADILTRSRRTRIILLLDEVGTFLTSERSTTHIAVMFLQLLTVIRKFNVCIMMLTPTKTDVSYRFRNFFNAKNEKGNLNMLWSKDYAMAEAYIRLNDLRTEPYQYTTIQYGEHGRKHLFFVPATSWTRDTDQLDIGEFTYDHTSLASFEIGHEKFNMNKFLNKFKKVKSARIPGLIREYLDELDNEDDEGDESPRNDALRERMDRADRWRSQNRTWREIGELEGVPWKTIYNQFKKYHNLKDGDISD